MELTEQRRDQLVDYFAGKIKSARLEVPGILFLETIKPLAFLGSQAMLFFSPFLAPVFGFKRMDDFSSFLGDRDNLERILKRLEDGAVKGGR